MSTANTGREQAHGTFAAIATYTALLAIATAVRIMLYPFSDIDIQPIGAGVAALSILVLGLMVVAAAPKEFRAQRNRRFNWIVGIAMACNIGSHVVWGLVLAVGSL